jgi:hypothetical protein
LLTEVEEKRLQWFGYLKRMDRTSSSRRVLELIFKGKRPME